jgi:predicted amidohydrolase
VNENLNPSDVESGLVRIAGVQMDVALMEPEQNLATMAERLTEAAGQGARLIVFPECAVTGYCFDSLEEAQPLAQPIPGPATETISELCRQLDVFAVFGMLESDGDRVFNACLLTGPDGVVASYRKIHLPGLGIDRFVTPGDRPFQVHQAAGLRIGMNICYDGSFPESSRIMALAGADLVVLPTNWPPGAECFAAHVINTRAMENGIFYIAVNRIGTERGFPFIGGSRICGPNGNTLDTADHTEPAILYADVDPARARNKRYVRVPDKHEIDRFADRQPHWYGDISE